jgi:hypothetical protein
MTLYGASQVGFHIWPATCSENEGPSIQHSVTNVTVDSSVAPCMKPITLKFEKKN